MTNVDQIKDKARGVITDQIDRRTTNLGNTVSEHVTNLRSMSETLRSQGRTTTANLVDSAVARLDSISNYLRNTDGDRIIHDVETITGKQPLATAAVGFAGGFIAARVLKASASQRYRTYGETYRSASYSTRSYNSGVDLPLGEDDNG